MGFSDFFRSAPHADATLGTLTRRGGQWYGQIALGGVSAPIALAGSKTAPSDRSLRLGRELMTRYDSLRPAIAGALFEHYGPYREALDAGELDEPEPIPRLNGPTEVWPHVTLRRVRIEPLDGVETVELAYETAWDVEHTLGARFRDWTLIELNGSVI
jgi:hypothetical protein